MCGGVRVCMHVCAFLYTLLSETRQGQHKSRGYSVLSKVIHFEAQAIHHATCQQAFTVRVHHGRRVPQPGDLQQHAMKTMLTLR